MQPVHDCIFVAPTGGSNILTKMSSIGSSLFERSGNPTVNAWIIVQSYNRVMYRSLLGSMIVSYTITNLDVDCWPNHFPGFNFKIEISILPLQQWSMLDRLTAVNWVFLVAGLFWQQTKTKWLIWSWIYFLLFSLSM